MVRGCRGRGRLGLASLTTSTTPPALDQPQLCSTSTYLALPTHLSRHPRRLPSSARLLSHPLFRPLPPLDTATLLSPPSSPITLLFFVSASGTSLRLIKNDSRYRSRYLLGLYLPRYLKLPSSVETSQVAAVFQKLEPICQSVAYLHTHVHLHRTVEHESGPHDLTVSDPSRYSLSLSANCYGHALVRAWAASDLPCGASCHNPLRLRHRHSMQFLHSQVTPLLHHYPQP